MEKMHKARHVGSGECEQIPCPLQEHQCVLQPGSSLNLIIRELSCTNLQASLASLEVRVGVGGS